MAGRRDFVSTRPAQNVVTDAIQCLCLPRGSKCTEARYVYAISDPVCCKPFVMERIESNFLFRAYVLANASAAWEALFAVALGTSQWDRYNSGGGAQKRI